VETGVVSAEEVKAWEKKFAEAMDGDLNTSAALATVFDAAAWSRHQKYSADSKKQLLELVAMVSQTFGCFDSEEAAVPADILTLAKKRDEARAKKDFAESDRLRDELQNLGYEVRDSKEGTQVKKK
jgi:cysteinyl-tRNA synthetase